VNPRTTQRRWWLLGIIAVLIVGTFLSPRLPQPGGYHTFADHRTLFGVPHALNVLSNLAFLAVGGVGIVYVLKHPELAARRSYFVLFLGVALTCFGSSYYHLGPGNERLVWDRLPMTLGFTGLFVAALCERVDVRLESLLAPLIVYGFATVAYWRWTETQQAGDLRPYLLLQFAPLLLVPLLVLLFPPKFSRGYDIFIAIGFYAFAKVVELGDDQVFAALGGLISGHSLKHLLAAFGVYWLLRMLKKREPVTVAPVAAPAVTSA
jgi:hypothetical protein